MGEVGVVIDLLSATGLFVQLVGKPMIGLPVSLCQSLTEHRNL